MPSKHAAMPRRVVRRRRASALQSAVAWLDLIRINPRRVPLHLLAWTAGLVAVLVTTLASRPALTQTASSPAPGTASQVAVPVVAETAASEPASSGLAPAEAAPQLRTHVVEAGDTLKALAEQYGVSVATIAVANQLANPDLISIGQELTIPPTSGLLAAIKPGETLGQLAERYGVDVPSVASVNQLAPIADQPIVGSKVVVPGIEPEIAVPSRPKPRTATEGEAVASAESKPEFRNNRGLASVTITGDDETSQPEKPVAKTKPPVVYEVEEGDTVRSLANQFGVSIATILMANNISDPDLIKPGMELRVLPVSGVEHSVEPGESLADIAAAYKVDLGPVIDFNGLSDPDAIGVGAKLIIPGATARVAVSQPRIVPQAPASAVAAAPPTGSGRAAAPQTGSGGAVSKPAAPAAAAAVAPARAVPAPVVGAGGGGVARNAMAYNGYRYVFGGSSPSGFDCSGFVWYVHKVAGINISRGLWGQLNGGPRISRENLSPGDTVFFANTYMPGLSHVGIYVGGGNFIHAIDEGSGVGVSSLSSSYWSSRYVGASRLY